MKLSIGAVVMAMLFMRPCESSAQEAEEPPDPHHVPRMGIEIGTSLGYAYAWERGHNSGLLIMPALGFGVLEEHGGALLRLGGGSVDDNERILNGEALLWLPHNINERGDVYLALGPLVRWESNARKIDVTAGAIFEGGADWLLMWPWVRMRYSIRARFTGLGADLSLNIGTTFWSWPL